MRDCSSFVAKVRPGLVCYRGALIPLLCLCLTACVLLVKTQDGRYLRATSPAFKDYAERVFRQQNNLSWALVEALDTVSDPEKLQHLTQLEIQLRQDCEAVNRLASAHRKGESSSRAQQLALVRALPQCEARSQEAQQLLNRLGDA